MIEDKEELNEQIQEEVEEEKPEKKKWNKLRDPEDMGAYICELRELHNMTQNNLATQLFLTRKAVSKWETGRGYPSLDVIPKIAEVLSTTLDELLTGKTEPVDYIMRNNKAINLMNQFVRNRKVKITVISTFLFLFTLLIMYFVANYNATQIYSIYYNDNGIHVENTIMVKTQSKEYLNIGSVYTDFKDLDDDAKIDYTLYVGDKEKIDTIIQKFSINKTSTHMENSNYQEIPTINLKDDFEKLFLKLEYINQSGETLEYTAKLNVILQYKSNDVFKSKINLKQSQNIKTENIIKESIDEKGINISFLYKNDNLKKIDGKIIDINNQIYNIKVGDDKVNIYSNNCKYKIDLKANIILYTGETKETYIISDDKIIIYNIEHYSGYAELKQIISTIKGSYI